MPLRPRVRRNTPPPAQPTTTLVAVVGATRAASAAGSGELKMIRWISKAVTAVFMKLHHLPRPVQEHLLLPHDTIRAAVKPALAVAAVTMNPALGMAFSLLVAAAAQTPGAVAVATMNLALGMAISLLPADVSRPAPPRPATQLAVAVAVGVMIGVVTMSLRHKAVLHQTRLAMLPLLAPLLAVAVDGMVLSLLLQATIAILLPATTIPLPMRLLVATTPPPTTITTSLLPMRLVGAPECTGVVGTQHATPLSQTPSPMKALYLGSGHNPLPLLGMP
jgi:hypothetical protein